MSIGTTNYYPFRLAIPPDPCQYLLDRCFQSPTGNSTVGCFLTMTCYENGLVRNLFIKFQGWKYQLIINNRYYILCFFGTKYRRLIVFNFFYRLSSFLCFLVTFCQLAKSLYFAFVFAESA